MAKPVSNPTLRVLQILEFLAVSPTEAYGLSELSRALGLSKTTCLSILNTLVDAGYVLQHPTRKHYTLGPSAVAVGQAALARFPDVGDLSPVLRRLFREFGMTATAEAVAGDQLVVVAAAGMGDPMRGIARTGVRLPFAPPYGAPLAAALDPQGFEDYLARAEPAVDRERTAALLRSFEVGRQRGFFVGLDLPTDHALHDRLEAVWQARAPGQELQSLSAARRDAGYFLDDIDDTAQYAVSVLSAPVVTRHGRVEIALALLAFGARWSGAQTRAAGQRLVQAAADLAERRSSD
ncbi:MAG: ArsR family transcriptional regulator [Phenylobacterium sp.]|nr:ArsR family transcriptional regulator [Phenylobacterium sp.]